VVVYILRVVMQVVPTRAERRAAENLGNILSRIEWKQKVVEKA